MAQSMRSCATISAICSDVPWCRFSRTLRIAAAELADDIRQDVARLRVRGADGQAPSPLVPQLRGQVLDALRFLQDAQRAVDDLLPGRA